MILPSPTSQLGPDPQNILQFLLCAEETEFININIDEGNGNDNIVPNNTQAQPNDLGIPPAHAALAAQTTPNPAHVAVTTTPNAGSIAARTGPVATDRRSNPIPNALGKVSFTTNICSLKMRASLIMFHYFPASHTGEALAKVILELLNCAEVTLKIRHLTIDNATNNIVAMHELARLLEACDIEFNALNRCIPCFPHIINICVTHAIKAYTTTNFTAVTTTWVGTLDNIVEKAEYLNALATAPVSLGCNIVHIICASSQCHKGFRDIIINGNANQWYTGDITQVPLIELLHNGIDSFLSLPHGPNDELAWHKLTLMQWEVLQDLEVVLEVPHAAQQCMSSESTPMLGGEIPAFKILVMQWEVLAIKAPHCAPYLKARLGKAQECY
ncbi:hypothetical protein JVU11DRAFT_10602 [Chiua virens]|nr:hypothetical protein JVU11DRAFT_10602 [Chiua virens]